MFLIAINLQYVTKNSPKMQKYAWEKRPPTQNNEFTNTLKPAYILSLYLIKKKKHQLQLY